MPHPDILGGWSRQTLLGKSSSGEGAARWEGEDSSLVVWALTTLLLDLFAFIGIIEKKYGVFGMLDNS